MHQHYELQRLIAVALRAVRPNPFRCIEKYVLDEGKIAQLRASIRSSGFWTNILLRETADGEFQLQYGHHRHEAALRELGDDYRHEFVVQTGVADHIMLRRLADENSEDWSSSVQHQKLIVARARQYLNDLLSECPTWDAAISRSDNVITPQSLETWFGPDMAADGNGKPGPANYARCQATGVGRKVIANLLGATWSPAQVQKVLSLLPPDPRYVSEEASRFDPSAADVFDNIHQAAAFRAAVTKPAAVESIPLSEQRQLAETIVAKLTPAAAGQRHDNDLSATSIVKAVDAIAAGTYSRRKYDPDNTPAQHARANLQDTERVADRLVAQLQITARRFQAHPEWSAEPLRRRCTQLAAHVAQSFQALQTALLPAQAGNVSQSTRVK
jgi:hypothetical protein